MKSAFALLPVLAGLAAPALAQETTAPQLLLELNAAQPSEKGCRITFLATNELGGTLDRASVEMALFTIGGAIERIVTLDFKGLTEGKTKVLQFELANLDCANLGRVLINDITACQGDGLAAEACLAGLVPSARPETIAFGV